VVLPYWFFIVLSSFSSDRLQRQLTPISLAFLLLLLFFFFYYYYYYYFFSFYYYYFLSFASFLSFVQNPHNKPCSNLLFCHLPSSFVFFCSILFSPTFSR
jgi:hypothetical protein